MRRDGFRRQLESEEIRTVNWGIGISPSSLYQQIPASRINAGAAAHVIPTDNVIGEATLE